MIEHSPSPAKYALWCLCAADIAPSLCSEIQSLYESNMAIAKAQTIEQAKALVNDALATLPPPFTQNLDDQSLTRLIENLL